MTPNLPVGVIGNRAFNAPGIRWSAFGGHRRRQRQLRGNFAPTCSMAGIINGATRVSRRRETVL